MCLRYSRLARWANVTFGTDESVIFIEVSLIQGYPYI